MQTLPQYTKGSATWTVAPVRFHVEGKNLESLMQTFIVNNLGKLQKDPALYFVKMREWFHAMGFSKIAVTVDRDAVWYRKPFVWIWLKWAWFKYMSEGDSAFHN